MRFVVSLEFLMYAYTTGGAPTSKLIRPVSRLHGPRVDLGGSIRGESREGGRGAAGDEGQDGLGDQQTQGDALLTDPRRRVRCVPHQSPDNDDPKRARVLVGCWCPVRQEEAMAGVVTGGATAGGAMAAEAMAVVEMVEVDRWCGRWRRRRWRRWRGR